MILMVTYDLRTSGKNYSSLYDALKVQGEWWHYLASAWLISTTKSPQQVYNEVVTHITTNDSILIIQVAKNYWGYLPKEAWDWINAHG